MSVGWRKRNPERSKEGDRRYRELNKDKCQTASREYRRRAYRADPARFRADSKRRRIIKKAQVDAFQMEQGCIDCGYRGHPAALDFDHRDPSTKSFAISINLHRSWSELWAEIAKCDVRCANCHRIRTHDERHSQFRMDGAPSEPSPQLALFEEAS